MWDDRRGGGHLLTLTLSRTTNGLVNGGSSTRLQEELNEAVAHPFIAETVR